MTCNPTHCPLKARIALLESIVLEGKPVPDLEWDRIVAAFMEGDSGPLERWNERKRRGGDARHAVTDMTSRSVG